MSKHEPHAPDEAVLRLRVAVAGEAGELASLLAARVAGDRELGAVGEPDAAGVEPARELLLHDRDQLDQAAQPAVVLRLVGQMRKPARQHPPDQAEELPVRADPDRRLTDRERDQLRVTRQRRPARPSRDRILIGEHIRCNDKGFQIRHLELQSRGDTGLEAQEQPLRLHHHAYAVKDQEVNRHFIEDILGIPLVATWCERVFFADVGHEVEFCHTFFEVKDGGALAFFQYADEAAWQSRGATQQSGGAQHIAFKVTQGTFDELMQRATGAGIPVRKTDHGFCVSMYLASPDGLRLEFTVDAPDAEKIAAMRRKDAHSELARWMAGDRRTNNDDRPH